jgi:hypothetical protein
MRKLITVAVLFGLCLSASFAQADDKKGKGQADAERAKLLKQLAELKSALAKQQDISAKNRAGEQKARAIAEQKKAEAINQLKKYGGKAAFDKATYEKKLRYLLQNPSKGGKKPLNPKGHVKPGADKLEHFRAAIKHLQAAGEKELVHAAVAQYAERYQAELQKASQPPVKGGGKGFVKGGNKGGGKGSVKGGGKGVVKGSGKGVVKGGNKGGGKGFVKGGVKKPQSNTDATLQKLSTAILQLNKQVQSLQQSVDQLKKGGKK